MLLRLLTQIYNDIENGFNFSCALINSGVKCWGDNNAGELGRGFTDSPSGYRSTADYVSGLTSGVSDIAAGSIKSETTCALINGGVKCWGELGDGTTIDKNVPTIVAGGLGSANDVIKVAPGRYFSCALQTDNRLKCWGQNDYGQLGIGITQSSPAGIKGKPTVSLIASGAKKLSVGRYYACVILNTNDEINVGEQILLVRWELALQLIQILR